MEPFSIEDGLQPTLEPQAWARGLENVRVLNLLGIPHFGCSPDVNCCVNLFLSCVHGRFTWLDINISNYADTIKDITGLPAAGEDPAGLFAGKR